MHKRKVSIQLPLKIPSNDWYTTINLRRHPKNTDGIRGTRIESPVHACALEGQKYWFHSVISFVTKEHKKDIKSSIGSLEDQKSFFFCWTFVHECLALILIFYQRHHVDDMPRRIPPDNNLTPKAKRSSTTTQKHTSQQKHNTTTLLKRIISTMAKSGSVPRGSNPPSSTPTKRNKRDGINDASNERKHQKTNNNAKSKEALDNTSSKTGTVTVHVVDNSVATCTADPDSSGNARHDKQQQKQQSKETTERNKSNADDPKTPENNINTPVRRSTVSKKTMFSILENIDLFHLSLIITFSLLWHRSLNLHKWHYHPTNNSKSSSPRRP